MLARSLFRRSMAAGLLCVLAASIAYGNTSVGNLEPTTGTWRAYRGSNFDILVCSNSSEAAMLQCVAADAERRAATTRYQLRYPNRYVTVSYTRPTCPTPPPEETRPGTCPAGTEGSWTQTGTTTFGPAPACVPTVTWRPVTAPDGICHPVTPPPLPAPTGITATAQSTSVNLVRWNVVSDALSYQVKRCIVPTGQTTCTELRNLICTQILSQTHVTLPPGTLVRYQVAASRSANCAAPLGADSAIVEARTLTTPPPPEPTVPRACSSRVCDVSWTPNGPADGFRIFFSRTDGAWSNAPAQVAGSVTRTDVTMPETGIWYFAVKSFIGGTESELSNVVVRDVQ